MEKGREIINPAGTTLCLHNLVYVCISGNSTGLMSGNYIFLSATATQQQELFPQSSKPPSSKTCSFVMVLQTAVKGLFKPRDDVMPHSFLANIYCTPQLQQRKWYHSKVCFWDRLCPEDKSSSMDLFWPIYDLPVVFIGKCSHISMLHL